MTFVVRIRYGDGQTMTREYADRLPAMREYHHGCAESVHAVGDDGEVAA